MKFFEKKDKRYNTPLDNYTDNLSSIKKKRVD